jgi:DNA-binding transcriptional MocR family regulator
MCLRHGLVAQRPGDLTVGARAYGRPSDRITDSRVPRDPIVKANLVEPAPASDSLHRQVAEALKRGARVQQKSHALIAGYREVDAALRETLATVRARRGAVDEPPSPGGR